MKTWCETSFELRAHVPVLLSRLLNHPCSRDCFRKTRPFCLCFPHHRFWDPFHSGYTNFGQVPPPPGSQSYATPSPGPKPLPQTRGALCAHLCPSPLTHILPRGHLCKISPSHKLDVNCHVLSKDINPFGLLVWGLYRYRLL